MSSEGSGETTHLHRLTRVFAARICDKNKSRELTQTFNFSMYIGYTSQTANHSNADKTMSMHKLVCAFVRPHRPTATEIVSNDMAVHVSV